MMVFLIMTMMMTMSLNLQRKRRRRSPVAVPVFKLPPLASHSDVFGGLRKQKGTVCGNCSANCDSGRYEYSKVLEIVFAF